jgi:hypothetical protein
MQNILQQVIVLEIGACCTFDENVALIWQKIKNKNSCCCCLIRGVAVFSLSAAAKVSQRHTANLADIFAVLR